MMIVDDYLDNVDDDSLNLYMNNDDLNEIIYYGMKKILDESNLKDL